MCFTFVTHICVSTHSPTNDELFFSSKLIRLADFLITCFLLTMCFVCVPHDVNFCLENVFYAPCVFTFRTMISVFYILVFFSFMYFHILTHTSNNTQICLFCHLSAFTSEHIVRLSHVNDNFFLLCFRNI